MTRYTYPHTIENGAGERITFVRHVSGTAGDRLEGENVVQPGAGPPMHVHHLQEEVLTVRQGRMGYQGLGEPARYAGPGETVAFAPGEAHKFWNAGEGDLLCTGHIEPVHNVEYFLTEMFASMKRHGGGRPGLFDMAFLATRFRSEYAVLEIPSAVQRIVFPVLVAVGRLLGRYERFADAPPPSPADGTAMTASDLKGFATRYTAAWCSQDTASVAAFFAERGSLTINGGAPSVGRAAITAAAQSFMTTFPDMIVSMDGITGDGNHAVYRWTLTGTNTGPGGTGRAVRISGYEEWTFGADGLIAESQGHFDDAEYQRQLSGGAP